MHFFIFLTIFSVYKEAIDGAKEYAKNKGPGTQAKPDQHQFFRRLAAIIQRTGRAPMFEQKVEGS